MHGAGSQSQVWTDDGKGTPWIVDRSDNICGLDDPKVLSNPARVDYQDLLDATPEIKLMKREKITRDSARGIQLTNQAENRVRDECEAVRSDKGYCSVWKSRTAETSTMPLRSMLLRCSSRARTAERVVP